MPPNVSSLYRLGLSKRLGVGQFYECIIEALYASILSAVDVCIDGGVNRGQHTFGLSKAVGSSGLVIGFEALHERAQQVRVSALGDSKCEDDVELDDCCQRDRRRRRCWR